MKKIKAMFNSKAFKKVLAVSMSICALACMFVFGASAAGADDASAAVSAATNIFGTVTGSLTIANIVSILGIALGAAVVLFLFWWGARKVVRMITAAFKKGKVSL